MGVFCAPLEFSRGNREGKPRVSGRKPIFPERFTERESCAGLLKGVPAKGSDVRLLDNCLNDSLL